MDPEKKAAIAAARGDFDKLPENAKKALKTWWETHLALGHRTLGKILVGRKIKGEDDEEEA